MPTEHDPRRDAARPVVLVTGAARGIGLAVCQRFVREGCRVAALDSDERTLSLAAQPLRAEGHELLELPVDVRSAARVEEAVERIESSWGPIATLVSVAGILRVGLVCELSEESFRDTLDTNVLGTFHVCQSVARRMQARRVGNIVAVGSNAASVARTHMAAYAASKAALRSFMQCLGLELAEFGIRCNVVSPGSTDTDMQRAYWSEAQGEREVLEGNAEGYRVGIPLRRLAEPEDVANAAWFLASNQARHITLHDLRVDGGATLGA